MKIDSRRSQCPTSESHPKPANWWISNVLQLSACSDIVSHKYPMDSYELNDLLASFIDLVAEPPWTPTPTLVTPSRNPYLCSRHMVWLDCAIEWFSRDRVSLKCISSDPRSLCGCHGLVGMELSCKPHLRSKVYIQLAQSCLNFRSSQKILWIQTSTLNKTFMEQITCT